MPRSLLTAAALVAAALLGHAGKAVADPTFTTGALEPALGVFTDGLLVAGVQGVFIAVDGFLLFFFYELAVLPMYVMIVIWGWKERREYAAMKLTLYLLIGSYVMLAMFSTGAESTASGKSKFFGWINICMIFKNTETSSDDFPGVPELLKQTLIKYKAKKIWRRVPESNRGRWICNPLHSHFANPPIKKPRLGEVLIYGVQCHR